MIAPTLLVGLGGTGSKIVKSVAKLVTPEQSEQIAFAVFDTDINELREIEEANPFIKTIQTSTKQTVGEYLNKDTHARDTWFPVNAILNGKTLTEGAGQVRSISRLALDTAIRAGEMEPLHEAIQSLYKVDGDKDEQALRVIIVSSLAGGTGSGLILPVALYIKNYLATRFRQSANITRGFFILPEVFDEVITEPAERKNLRANAYATLRELDAFLMKGDDTLPERYKDSVKMEFPRIASEGYEEYDVKPYDFCFLFDAQNAKGGKLNSFKQYIQHAANCIYSQSIGPMNKRSNSSEDNVILKLAKERGRNRYAGAGSSMLIYPFEDIKEYVALKWTMECVSKRWLVFDQMYKNLCKRNDEMRGEGLSVPDVNPASNYIMTVEQMAKDRNAFAKAIVNVCANYAEDGLTKTTDKWMDYLAALENKVEDDMLHGQPDLDSERSNVSDILEKSTKTLTWKNLQSAYAEVVRYRLMVEKRVEELSPTMAYTMFKAPNSNITGDKLSYQLETYLRDAEGNFIHPNAVRYFLYKSFELLKAKKIMVDAEVKELQNFFETYAGNHFDNDKTENVVEEDPSILSQKKDGAFGNSTPEQLEFKESLSEYVSNIDRYRVAYTLNEVIKEGMDYIKDISEAFMNFYKSFEGKITAMDKRIQELHKKYNLTKGMTARYVCASSKCLDSIYENMPYTGSTITIDGKLADEIYSRVRNYAMIPPKARSTTYFDEIFENGILGFFKTSLMNAYGTDLDIDIISAIEKEANYEEEEYDDLKVMQYVRNVISETRALSCPFIEMPLGATRAPIDACAFHPDLNPEDDSPRARLIDKDLMNHGGIADDDINKNMILFYQSFYGLRANDLSKFAPPERSFTYNRSGGEYFKAYYERIEGVHPETHKSKEICPHIDRWWHIITKMPDLDEKNQIKQEKEIYGAFFWGILCKYIDLYEENLDQKIYKLRAKALNMEDETLVVSNGTECDKLYEVLDAISIYPELVNKILEKVNASIMEDVNDRVNLKESMLYDFLKSFTIKEFALKGNKARSIFDIPMLMKKSATPDIYYEKDVLCILESELEEIEKYFAKFCSPKELPAAMGALLKEQFEKYLNDVEAESKTRVSIYRESLFDKTCDVIIGYFEKLGLKNDAKAIRKRVSELRM